MDSALKSFPTLLQNVKDLFPGVSERHSYTLTLNDHVKKESGPLCIWKMIMDVTIQNLPTSMTSVNEHLENV